MGRVFALYGQRRVHVEVGTKVVCIFFADAGEVILLGQVEPEEGIKSPVIWSQLLFAESLHYI